MDLNALFIIINHLKSRKASNTFALKFLRIIELWNECATRNFEVEKRVYYAFENIGGGIKGIKS